MQAVVSPGTPSATRRATVSRTSSARAGATARRCAMSSRRFCRRQASISFHVAVTWAHSSSRLGRMRPPKCRLASLGSWSLGGQPGPCAAHAQPSAACRPPWPSGRHPAAWRPRRRRSPSLRIALVGLYFKDLQALRVAARQPARRPNAARKRTMAKIIGGIGSSHVPTIGVAYDKGKQNDPAWKPLFDGYKPVAAWLAEHKADVLVFFYNDHVTSFFFDLYPTFSLGVSDNLDIADAGAGKRPLPPIRGDLDLSIHIAESLINDEFDIATFQDRPIDHGCAAPPPLLW